MSELQAAVLSKLDRDELAQMAREIVEIRSPTSEEAGVAEYVARAFRGLGMRVELQEVEANRENVICTLKGAGGGKSLMITGHMDTSPSNAPGYYSARVDGDWLFGPGATNMKGCFIAAYGAAKTLREAGVRLRGDLLVTAVVGEMETSPVDSGLQVYSGAAYRGAGLGTDYMLRNGVIADMAIIGEPTGLRVQCGNTGYIYAKISTFGKSQHTHARHAGVSALDKMLKVVPAIQAWESEYQSQNRHPRMLPMVNVGALVSGKPTGPNLTPYSAHLFVHITTIPGAEPLVIKHQLEEIVARAGAGDPEFRSEVSFFQIRLAYEIPEDAFVAQVAHRAHQSVFGEPSEPIAPARYSVSSDGSFFQLYNIPSITYGPGGFTQRGNRLNKDEVTGEEALNFENLANCARVYALSALEACGVAD